MDAVTEHALYGRLTDWYRLLDPTEDHEEEVAVYVAAMRGALGDVGRGALLELGAGAGNNGFFLARSFDCTLSDPSEAMLALSRALNPGCAHVVGDMRSLRLGRAFDAVLVHDAICYMLTLDDLRAAARTAFVHLRPGGVAVFAPDCFRDTFVEQSEVHEAREGDRSLHALALLWDPDPDDTTYVVDYAFLLRRGATVTHVHDRHVEGLFSRQAWRDALAAEGFEVATFPRPLDDDDDATAAYADEVFLCRRPA